MLEYYNALERLKKNQPERVKKGSKITKASVAREAGHDPSAIKASRPGFARLINEIELVAKQRIKPVKELQEKYDKLKVSRDEYKLRLEEALGRELLLIRRLEEIENK